MGKAIVFAELMCIRIFEDLPCNPARNGPRHVANDQAARNIFGEAQTFAELMGIRRYWGQVYLSASQWWKTGRLTRQWQVSLGRTTIFITSMAISRYREESSQAPTTGTKPDGSEPNGEYFCPGQLFSTTRVHTGTKAGGEPKGGSEINGANRGRRQKFLRFLTW